MVDPELSRQRQNLEGRENKKGEVLTNSYTDFHRRENSVTTEQRIGNRPYSLPSS